LTPNKGLAMLKEKKCWEDNWLELSNIAIQFRGLYVLVNEKVKTIPNL
jgi:hypothetical protein